MMIRADKIHLGDRLVCSDGEIREIDMIERGRWDGKLTFRFSFTDGKWLECPISGLVTKR